MQPDLNLRRQRLAARSSQMVTAKPLGQLPSVTIVQLGAGVVGSSPAAGQFFFMYFPLTHSVSFIFYIFWCRYRPCGLKGTVWDGDLATVLDWRELSTTGL